MDRPSLFSKRVIDLLNSAAWFAMDALWIARLELAAYVAAGLTVVTGLVLLVLAWREDRSALYADLGLNCWIIMNTLWLVADINERQPHLGLIGVVAALGAFCIAAAGWHSQDFRRLRVLGR